MQATLAEEQSEMQEGYEDSPEGYIHTCILWPQNKTDLEPCIDTLTHRVTQ